jgi:hypothetical protein
MRALRRRVVHKYWTRPAERLRAGEEMAAILEGKRRILETRERIQALESRVPRPGRRKVPSDCVGPGYEGLDIRWPPCLSQESGGPRGWHDTSEANGTIGTTIG